MTNLTSEDYSNISSDDGSIYFNDSIDRLLGDNTTYNSNNSNNNNNSIDTQNQLESDDYYNKKSPNNFNNDQNNLNSNSNNSNNNIPNNTTNYINQSSDSIVPTFAKVENNTNNYYYQQTFSQPINIYQEHDKNQLNINYFKLNQYSSQLTTLLKQAYNNIFVCNDEIDTITTLGSYIQMEISSLKESLLKRRIAANQSQSSSSSPPSTNRMYIHQQQQQQQQQQHHESIVPSCSISSSTSSFSPNGYYSPNTSDLYSSMGYASTISSPVPSYSSPIKHSPVICKKKGFKGFKPSPTYINLTENMIKAQTKKSKKLTNNNRVCLNCKTSDTPEWRRGPQGAKTLCNACGIRYRLTQQQQNQQQIIQNVNFSSTLESCQTNDYINNNNINNNNNNNSNQNMYSNDNNNNNNNTNNNNNDNNSLVNSMMLECQPISTDNEPHHHNYQQLLSPNTNSPNGCLSKLRHQELGVGLSSPTLPLENIFTFDNNNKFEMN
ncbi:hypothetical protein CYY_004714 [Polysphondylium violaceum]|uniref:GATA-type domain-containing protein n=1 Tax=Polysphondylium violaceum TaxID=133409 RepID=A0A8J4PWE5_9MYCE|nr:hypothetical protein CYY_004714 [Polysphondylium violaceum]